MWCLIFIYLSYFFSLPALSSSPNPEPRVLEIQVPASAIQENKLHNILTGTPIIQSIMALPTNLAASVLQQHINSALSHNVLTAQKQVDGTADTSDDEDGSDVSDDNIDNDDEDDNDLQVSLNKMMKLKK